MMSLIKNKQFIKKLFFDGIASVKTDKLINSILKLEKDQIIIDSKRYDLSKGKCYIVGFGKAVTDMAFQVEKILNKKLYRGILSIPQGLSVKNNDSKIKICKGGYNNIPDINSIEATDEIIRMTTEATENDLVLVLISGGGSALLSKPKDGLKLDEKIELITTLANSGANIKELNCVRKRISDVKGGKLSNFIYPASSVSFILSDIVGDPMDLIASGPTVQNTETIDKAIEILKKYNINNNKYYDIIKNDKDVENKIFDKVNNIILANNEIALKSIKNLSNNNSFSTIILSSTVEQNIEHLSYLYAKLTQLILNYKENKDFLLIETVLNELNIKYSKIQKLKNILDGGKCNICLLFGGETVANVRGKGKGGRNQELVLRYSKCLDSLYNGNLNESKVTFLSGGTDGIDGPTDAAGAITFPNQSIDAINQGLIPDDYLNNSDSYNYFNQLNNSEDILKIGHTGVNVMDIHIILMNLNDQI